MQLKAMDSMEVDIDEPSSDGDDMEVDSRHSSVVDDDIGGVIPSSSVHVMDDEDDVVEIDPATTSASLDPIDEQRNTMKNRRKSVPQSFGAGWWKDKFALGSYNRVFFSFFFFLPSPMFCFSNLSFPTFLLASSSTSAPSSSTLGSSDGSPAPAPVFQFRFPQRTRRLFVSNLSFVYPISHLNLYPFLSSVVPEGRQQGSDDREISSQDEAVVIEDDSIVVTTLLREGPRSSTQSVLSPTRHHRRQPAEVDPNQPNGLETHLNDAMQLDGDVGPNSVVPQPLQLVIDDGPPIQHQYDPKQSGIQVGTFPISLSRA